MDNELHAAIVDAAQRGATVSIWQSLDSDKDLSVWVSSVSQSSHPRTINTTDPAIMAAAIRDLTEQVTR